MSTDTVQKLRDELLHLPQAERAELAYALVQSLDGVAEADNSSAWDREIHRRLDQIEAGSAAMVDRDEFSARMLERLNRS